MLINSSSSGNGTGMCTVTTSLTGKRNRKPLTPPHSLDGGNWGFRDLVYTVLFNIRDFTGKPRQTFRRGACSHTYIHTHSTCVCACLYVHTLTKLADHNIAVFNATADWVRYQPRNFTLSEVITFPLFADLLANMEWDYHVVIVWSWLVNWNEKWGLSSLEESFLWRNWKSDSVVSKLSHKQCTLPTTDLPGNYGRNLARLYNWA